MTHSTCAVALIAHIVSLMRPNGALIRQRRERLGHGLNRFAVQAGVSASHLSRIERGVAGAQPELLQRIARALGVTLEDIAGDV